ncbi:hypothetical protein UFOVP1616_50 [uncultured Caudovirales phage]|uniref:Phage major tail protein TP901-1 n=1 Tax=uncultured Caudovirales phage TaxID=2100421 RepID=A0A6J5SK19_9CAUD|nr:hypothetical protein UFOVP1467_3 [uncultured Caudovirales phage]CAB4219669.1 hypothetical protein UFOVP1616_50 [uncultured Caudovirales phage]
MAKVVLKDAFVSINSVDLSDHVASVTLTSTDDVVETTGMGANSKTRVAGLTDNSISIEFHQDFVTSSVEATIFPLLGTVTTVLVRPTSAVVGATNPSYTMSALVSEWTPIDGTVGALATSKVTWPISGAITKAVA